MTPLDLLEASAAVAATAIPRRTARGLQAERLQAGVLLPDLALTTGLGIVFLIKLEQGAVELDGATYDRISTGIKQVASSSAGS
jgi:hypothetical protein